MGSPLELGGVSVTFGTLLQAGSPLRISTRRLRSPRFSDWPIVGTDLTHDSTKALRQSEPCDRRFCALRESTNLHNLARIVIQITYPSRITFLRLTMHV